LKWIRIKLFTARIDSHVIMTENYTQNDGSTAYKVTDLAVELLKLVREKMILTACFLAQSLNTEFDSFVKATIDLKRLYLTLVWYHEKSYVNSTMGSM